MKFLRQIVFIGNLLWISSTGIIVAGCSDQPGSSHSSGIQSDSASDSHAAIASDVHDATTSVPTLMLPRLVDLGAKKCIPCKMMAPILEELQRDYAGIFQVDFIDVWENPEAAQQYRIRVIPTQIFFDTTGRERFRHEGFMSKQAILEKWRDLGIELPPGAEGPRSN